MFRLRTRSRSFFSSQSEELDKNLLKNLRFIWGWLPYWVAGQDKFGQPLKMVGKKMGGGLLSPAIMESDLEQLFLKKGMSAPS